MKEIKAKRDKLGVILTAFTPDANYKAQAIAAANLGKSAAFVTIHGPAKTMSVEQPYVPGLTYILSKSFPVPVKSMIAEQLMRFHGDKMFVFMAPETQLSPDWSKLYDFTTSNKMERVWGFYHQRGVNGPIDVIGFTGPVVEHIFQGAPDKLTFTDGEWQKWMHNWAQRTIQKQRYFNVAGMGLVLTDQSVQPSPAKTDVPAAPFKEPTVSFQQALPPSTPPAKPPRKKLWNLI